jgi:hypothetical protein
VSVHTCGAVDPPILRCQKQDIQPYHILILRT